MSSKEKFAGQAKKLAYAAFDRETANIVINNFEIINNSVNVTSIMYDDKYQYSMWPRHFMDQSNINYVEFINSLK